MFGPLADAGINVDMIVQNVGHDGATDISFTVPRVELPRAEKVLAPVVTEMGARGITTDPTVAKVSIIGAGLHNAPGYAARMFGTLADAGVNIEMISTSEVRITCVIGESGLSKALEALHGAFELERPDPVDAEAAALSRASHDRSMTDVIDTAVTSWLSRFERFDVVGSTNDVVAGWLRDGTKEVCVAITDVQTSGRGRGDRTWAAPPGAALLLSIGFRPTWLEPEHAWRLAAIVTLTMAEACEVAAGLRAGTVQLKWPNDLVAIDSRSGDVRKLAGVLGETDGLGTKDARAVIGIGVNADWKPEDFPPELATSMTSLAELAPGQLIDREVDRSTSSSRSSRRPSSELQQGPLPGRRPGERVSSPTASRSASSGRTARARR